MNEIPYLDILTGPSFFRVGASCALFKNTSTRRRHSHTHTLTHTHTHTHAHTERKKEQRKTTMSAGNECSIFKTAAVFVLRKEKRLMSSREICMFALANDLLGEKERRVVPEKSMQKTLIVDAEQEEENARLFVRRTVDEQSFFGLRECYSCNTSPFNDV